MHYGEKNNVIAGIVTGTGTLTKKIQDGPCVGDTLLVMASGYIKLTKEDVCVAKVTVASSLS